MIRSFGLIIRNVPIYCIKILTNLVRWGAVFEVVACDIHHFICLYLNKNDESPLQIKIAHAT